MTNEERLTGLADSLIGRDREIAELREQIEEMESKQRKAEYDADWRWRHLRTFSEEENRDLPLPRLEIRIREVGAGYGTISDYGLVYQSMCEGITFVPMGSSIARGQRSEESKPACAAPWSMLQDMQHDMWTMKLPGHIVDVEFDESKEVIVTYEEAPGGLQVKMKAAGKGPA